MEIKQVQFNAREAEWSEAKKLGREDVAGVYHINPALIWPGSGQTYASAKDNARALYSETLAPKLMEATDKANATLLRMVGEPPRHYVEFDLSVKLQGSFEERASVIQSAVGAPWMLRDEARAMFNLPHVPGGDELIVPLNVVEGGLASPNDTDPTIERYNSTDHDHKCACKGDAHEISYKAEATDAETASSVELFRKFFARQSRSVLPRLQAAIADGTADSGDWWDSARWNRELEKDLLDLAQTLNADAAARALRGLGIDPGEYDTEQAVELLRSMCKTRAKWVNATTIKELKRAIELQAAGSEGLLATPEGVFENAEKNRVDSAGNAFATAVDSWSALDACKQSGVENIYKTWIVQSQNPRESHAKMDGQRVPLSAKFDNGMDWPGDLRGGADEVCGCQCTVSVSRTI